MKTPVPFQDPRSGIRLKSLVDALLALETREEAERFLRDLCTPAEIRSIADRWQVARLLDSSIPYREIHERTGVSTATVTRVARSLVQGEGGYRLILDRSSKKTGVSRANRA